MAVALLNYADFFRNPVVTTVDRYLAAFYIDSRRWVFSRNLPERQNRIELLGWAPQQQIAAEGCWAQLSLGLLGGVMVATVQNPRMGAAAK